MMHEYKKYIITYNDRSTKCAYEIEENFREGIDIVDFKLSDDFTNCDCMLYQDIYKNKDDLDLWICPSGFTPCGQERFELLSIREKESGRYLYIAGERKKDLSLTSSANKR